MNARYWPLLVRCSMAERSDVCWTYLILQEGETIRTSEGLRANLVVLMGNGRVANWDPKLALWRRCLVDGSASDERCRLELL